MEAPPRGASSRGPSGRFGRVGLPLLALFQVLLPLLAPLIDVFLVYGLVFLDPVKTLAGVGRACSPPAASARRIAFRLDREPLRLLWLAAAAADRLPAADVRGADPVLVTALAGVRLRWQKLRRVGGLDSLLVTPQPGRAMPEPAVAARDTHLEDRPAMVTLSVSARR